MEVTIPENMPAAYDRFNKIAALAIAAMENVYGQRSETVLSLIAVERARQTQQWGDDHDQYHSERDWFLFLSKQMGRLAEELYY